MKMALRGRWRVLYLPRHPGEPRMAAHFVSGDIQGWIERLAVLLDARVSWRLLPLLTGFLFATGRRTVSSWLRAGGLSNDYQDYYYFLSSLGHKVKSLAAVLLHIAVEV